MSEMLAAYQVGGPGPAKTRSWCPDLGGFLLPWASARSSVCEICNRLAGYEAAKSIPGASHRQVGVQDVCHHRSTMCWHDANKYRRCCG